MHVGCWATILLLVAAFNEHLMKSKRWLLSARPRVPEAPNWEHLLTVSPEVQELFVSRAILSFNSRARKVKSNCRARVRWSPEEWDRNVDFAALTGRLLERARLTSCSSVQLDDVKTAFFAGWSWYVYCQHRQPISGCRELQTDSLKETAITLHTMPACVCYDFQLLASCLPCQGLLAGHGGACDHQEQGV